jgi:hypothetical protein
VVSLNAKIKQNNMPKSAKRPLGKRIANQKKVLHLQKLPAEKTLFHHYSMATTQESCIASPLPNALFVTELWLQSPTYFRKLQIFLSHNHHGPKLLQTLTPKTRWG